MLTIGSVCLRLYFGSSLIKMQTVHTLPGRIRWPESRVLARVLTPLSTLRASPVPGHQKRSGCQPGNNLERIKQIRLNWIKMVILTQPEWFLQRVIYVMLWRLRVRIISNFQDKARGLIMDNLWHEEDIDVALKVTNDIHKSTFRKLIETCCTLNLDMEQWINSNLYLFQKLFPTELNDQFWEFYFN